jgi:HPr kinase/phosphorylase
MSQLQIKTLLDDISHSLKLSLLSGKGGLWHDLDNARFFTAGLILTGVEKRKGKNGIIILGLMEISFLEELEDTKLDDIFKKLLKYKPSCLVITKSLPPPAGLIEFSEKHDLPLLSTTLSTTDFIKTFGIFLEENSRETTRIHGVLLDVLGIGILLKGPSGIGKSEIALELIARGHRLVADDTVQIHKHHPNILEGMGTPVVKHHMEIRGLGIISIQALFGPTSVRDRKKIELVIKLEEWDSEKEYERLGLDEKYYSILDVELPLSVLPVRPGRSIATLIEVAARDRLLKARGIHSAKLFQRNLNKALYCDISQPIFEEEVE